MLRADAGQVARGIKGSVADNNQKQRLSNHQWESAAIFIDGCNNGYG